MTETKLYPSEAKRRQRQVMTPSKVFEPWRPDTDLAFALKEQLHQEGLDVQNGVNKKTALDAIITLEPNYGRREAYTKLKWLWRCGLVTRLGNIDNRSGRPRYQLWIIK